MKRRNFLKTSALATAATLTSPLFGAQKSTAGEDYKALVCILLEGGADSINMMIPKHDPNRYRQYRELRKNSAIPLEQVRTLTKSIYGFHPQMPRMQRMFNHGKMAVIANMGPLFQPLSSTQIAKAKTVDDIPSAPAGLFSHLTQRDHWMQAGVSHSGWATRLAKNIDGKFVNISTGGYNKMQDAEETETLIAHDDISGTHPFMKQVRRAATDTWFEEDESFEGKSLGEQLRMTLDLIEHRKKAGFAKRQIYFVSDGGWDLHSDSKNLQEAFAHKVANLDKSLYEFSAALEQLGLDQKVTTFTVSDFGRTLDAEGNNHGWGGHAFVTGGAVKGGIYGQIPQIAAKSPHTLDNGALIPTISSDQYQATLAAWLTDGKADLEALFPHLKNFKTKKLNFMA